MTDLQRLVHWEEARSAISKGGCLFQRAVKGNALGETAEEQAMTDIAWHSVIDRANADGEFRIAARLWNARVRLDLGADSVLLSIEAGTIGSAERCGPVAACDACISGEADHWERLLAPLPPPLWQDLFGAAARGDFTIGGDLEAFFAYYPAMRRLLDLVREDNRT